MFWVQYWTVLLLGLTESALCFLFRFSAAWKYILNLSKEEYSEKMILQILEISNKTASVVPMSPTVSTFLIHWTFQKGWGMKLTVNLKREVTAFNFKGGIVQVIWKLYDNCPWPILLPPLRTLFLSTIEMTSKCSKLSKSLGLINISRGQCFLLRSISVEVYWKKREREKAGKNKLRHHLVISIAFTLIDHCNLPISAKIALLSKKCWLSSKDFLPVSQVATILTSLSKIS